MVERITITFPTAQDYFLTRKAIQLAVDSLNFQLDMSGWCGEDEDTTLTHAVGYLNNLDWMLYSRADTALKAKYFALKDAEEDDEDDEDE